MSGPSTNVTIPFTSPLPPPPPISTNQAATAAYIRSLESEVRALRRQVAQALHNTEQRLQALEDSTE